MHQPGYANLSTGQEPREHEATLRELIRETADGEWGRELEYLYRVTGALLDEVNDADLGWKSATGENWKSTGQERTRDCREEHP